MHTDDSFLSAIEAEPADRVRRLVYADWLDDRHDPRAELVRVEEEMRELPVFADRFWELKPRRNELRALAGGDWCARMRYGTECEPVFRHGIPDGWRDRWRLIREFTERWHRIPMPDVGGRAKEIAEAEARLKRELPPSVREWVAFARDIHASPALSRDWLPARLQPMPSNSAISVWHHIVAHDLLMDTVAGVLESDCEQPDPLVYPFTVELDADHNFQFRRDGEVATATELSLFALKQLLDRTYGTSGYIARVELLSDLYRHLNREFETHTKIGKCELDEATNLLAEVEPVPGQVGMFNLTVRASAAIQKDRVPEFLFRYARLSDSQTGIWRKATK